MRSIFRKLKERSRCNWIKAFRVSLFFSFSIAVQSSVISLLVDFEIRLWKIVIVLVGGDRSGSPIHPSVLRSAFFDGYLPSSEGSAARGGGWNPASTSRMRFWLRLFPYARPLERDREDISNLVSIVILTNVLEDEKRVVGTSNRIIEIRNISIERSLLFHANYLFYEFNSVNSSLLSRVYFRFFFFFTRTRG